MKKLVCVLLTLIMTLSFAACGKEENSTVTIYIPSTISLEIFDESALTVYYEKTATATYVFEEGWQDKDSFTVTMSGDAEQFSSPTWIYSDGKEIIETEISTQKTRYNDNGQLVLWIEHYADGSRQELVRTYDSKGRWIADERKMYETADAEPVITVTNYTITDTEDGYIATTEMDGNTIVYTYDKNGWLISSATTRDGIEISRSEMSYDSVGNILSRVLYYNGQKFDEMKYTWKAVEVSSEVAARLPQFKRGN